MSDFIRLVIPWTDRDERDEIDAVLSSGYLTLGPKVTELERLVGDYVGARHAIATTSATTALHLTLESLGVGPGDEILVADFTFPATANAVVQTGATPVLVDIDPRTFTIDAGDLEKKITAASRAIIPVHTFGVSSDMDPIMALARARGLFVLEDAACALGTTYRSKRCGAIGHAAAFSFHPRKVITTGEGGMITTDDDALAARARLLRSHGGVREDERTSFVAAGFNYRLSDIHAAIGVAQMRKLDALIARKRALAAAMSTELPSAVRPPELPEWGGHIYQSYVVMLPEDVDRARVIARMLERGVETTIGTYALHAEPFFAGKYGNTPGQLPHSYAASRQTLTLPLHPGMTEGDAARVAHTLKWALGPGRAAGGVG